MIKFLSNSFEEVLARQKDLANYSFKFNPVACFEKPIECNFTSMIGTVSPGDSIFHTPLKVMVVNDLYNYHRRFTTGNDTMIFFKDGMFINSLYNYQVCGETNFYVNKFIATHPALKRFIGFSQIYELDGGYKLLEDLYELFKKSKKKLHELKDEFSFNMDRYPRSMEFQNISNYYSETVKSDDDFTDFLVRTHFHATMLMSSDSFGDRPKEILSMFARLNLMSLVSEEHLGPVERLDASINSAIEVLVSIYNRASEFELIEKALLETKDSIKDYCLKTFIQDPPVQVGDRVVLQQAGTEKPKKATPDSKPAN